MGCDLRDRESLNIVYMVMGNDKGANKEREMAKRGRVWRRRGEREGDATEFKILS